MANRGRRDWSKGKRIGPTTGEEGLDNREEDWVNRRRIRATGGEGISHQRGRIGQQGEKGLAKRGEDWVNERRDWLTGKIGTTVGED